MAKEKSSIYSKGIITKVNNPENLTLEEQCKIIMNQCGIEKLNENMESWEDCLKKYNNFSSFGSKFIIKNNDIYVVNELESHIKKPYFNIVKNGEQSDSYQYECLGINSNEESNGYFWNVIEESFMVESEENIDSENKTN